MVQWPAAPQKGAKKQKSFWPQEPQGTTRRCPLVLYRYAKLPFTDSADELIILRSVVLGLLLGTALVLGYKGWYGCLGYGSWKLSLHCVEDCASCVGRWVGDYLK